MPGRGYNTSGDLVTRTADGRDLNLVWDDVQALTRVAGGIQTAIDQLLTRRITVPAEDVVQSVSPQMFERSSEFGEPVGRKPARPSVALGARIDWYDTAARFTYKYLSQATAADIMRVADQVIDDDTYSLHQGIFGALFNSTTVVNDVGANVYPLWNGDSQLPPPYNGQTFSTHSHYLSSGAATFDAGDLDAVILQVTHHGYGVQNNGRILVFMNAAEMGIARGFKAGAGVPVAGADFVPSAAAPAFWTPNTIVGDQAPARFEGLPIAGSYGEAYLVETSLIPAGYILAVATHGPNSDRNVVSLREHPDSNLRNLKLVKGRDNDYPLQDSFWLRIWGTGVRHRGAACVMKITAAAYTDPTGFVGAP